MGEKQHGISRRDFLKLGSLSGLVAAVSGTRLLDVSKGDARSGSFSLARRTYDLIDEAYEIDPNIERMDQKYTMFSRAVWDPPSAPPQGTFLDFFAKFKKMAPNPDEGEPGSAAYDHASNLLQGLVMIPELISAQLVCAAQAHSQIGIDTVTRPKRIAINLKAETKLRK